MVAILGAVAVPPALLGARVPGLVSRDAFTFGISGMLLLLAAYLAWRPATAITNPVARGWRRQICDREGNVFVYRIPLLRGVVPLAGSALLSALTSIGGRILYVPLTTRLMHMPYTLAVPAAHIVIATLAVTVVASHLAGGHAGDPLRDPLWIAAGRIASIPLGERLHRRLGEGLLTRMLAADLVVVSARTAWGALPLARPTLRYPTGRTAMPPQVDGRHLQHLATIAMPPALA